MSWLLALGWLLAVASTCAACCVLWLSDDSFFAQSSSRRYRDAIKPSFRPVLCSAHPRPADAGTPSHCAFHRFPRHCGSRLFSLPSILAAVAVAAPCHYILWLARTTSIRNTETPNAEHLAAPDLAARRPLVAETYPSIQQLVVVKFRQTPPPNIPPVELHPPANSFLAALRLSKQTALPQQPPSSTTSANPPSIEAIPPSGRPPTAPHLDRLPDCNGWEGTKPCDPSIHLVCPGHEPRLGRVAGDETSPQAHRLLRNRPRRRPQRCQSRREPEAARRLLAQRRHVDWAEYGDVDLYHRPRRVDRLETPIVQRKRPAGDI